MDDRKGDSEATSSYQWHEANAFDDFDPICLSDLESDDDDAAEDEDYDETDNLDANTSDRYGLRPPFDEELVVDDELRNFAREMSHITEEDLTVLIAYNASYLEIIESLIAKADRSMDENRESQEDIHERLASKADDEKKPYIVPVILYSKPYFKDRYGMPPPTNAETAELLKNHRLITHIKEENLWRIEDLKKLRIAVREQLLHQMNIRLESRKTIVMDKIQNIDVTNTEAELKMWREEIASLDRKIQYNLKKPDNEIFLGDYSKISWSEVSVRNFDSLRSATACQMKWMCEQRPEINKKPWSVEEDEKLQETSILNLSNWSFVVAELGTNRSEFQCFCRIKEIEQRISTERNVWTAEEDEKLLSIVYGFNNLDSIPWEKVAKLMENRNPHLCRNHFLHSLQSTLNTGRWSYAEDMFLLDAVNRFGPIEWERIASCVPGRSAPQCRSRFQNVLTIKRNIQQYTLEEDEIILTCVKLLGRGKWSEICQLLSNRYPTDVRSRFRRFLFRKIKNLPPYDEINYRNSSWNQFSRRQDILNGFQAYETSDSAVRIDESIKRRFGIGDYVINSIGELQSYDNVIQQNKTKFGNIHIYSSGIWKKRPPTIEECRAQRFERMYKNVSEDIRTKLDDFLHGLAERRRLREMEFSKAFKGDMLEELEKKYREDDIERIRLLVEEAITVNESDMKQVRRNRLPRIRIRKAFAKKRTMRIKPTDLTKLSQAKSEEEFRKKCDVVREMHLSPVIAEYLNLQVEKIYRKDGTRRRISELVLMEDFNLQKYWVTERESTILKLILNLNQHLITNSMHFYESCWKNGASRRSNEYYLNQLIFNEVPSVYEVNKEEPAPLEAYVKLISDVMPPNRASLTALHQYRVRGRELCTSIASQYYDPLDENGYPESYTNFNNQQLDIELPNRIKNSVEYLLLRARMFKMFFLPMLLQYGQKSANAQNQIRDSIWRRQARRQRERIYEETKDVNIAVPVFEEDILTVGTPTTLIQNDKNNSSVVLSQMPLVFKRKTAESSRIDNSIDSLISKVVESNKNARSGRGRRKREYVNQISELPAPSALLPMNLQFAPENEEEIINGSEQPSTSKRRKNNTLDDLEVVALPPETVQNNEALSRIGAYQPRWVTKKKKAANREQPENGELTLADLLFVRGKKRRALTGTYDQEHTQMVFDLLRPKIEAELQKKHQEGEEEVVEEEASELNMKQESL